MSRIVNVVKKWRVGATSGLNAQENSIKMPLFVLGPFFVAWLFIQLFLPKALYDQYIGYAMAGWVIWGLALYGYAKIDINNFIVFTQSKWRFPDGTCKTFDLKLPPDSWEKVCDFPDGSVGYKVHDLGAKFIYDDPSMPFPRIFKKAYWLVPAPWDIAFQRRAFGEVFHRGMFVTKPDCEDISVYVKDFETVEGETFPVCLINDCAFTYDRVIKELDLPQLVRSDTNPYYALFRDARRRSDKLLQHTAYLEDRVQVSEKDSSKDFRTSADNRMKSVRQRHARVMDVKEPLLTRLLNLKTVAIAILVLLAIYLIGRLFLHVW